MKTEGWVPRVLVVDDEPLIRFGVVRHLGSLVEAKAAATAEEALDILKEHHFDLCFLDVFLPGMNGVDAMCRIHELSPATRVVIMTGSQLDDTMKKRIDDGAYAFIEKPFDLLQIKDLVKSISPVSGKPRSFKPDQSAGKTADRQNNL
jgi:two-component system nitrogen regulation response regulator NtrX